MLVQVPWKKRFNMNTLQIEGDKIVNKSLDTSIELLFLEKNDVISMNHIKLCIKEDTSLCIQYIGTEKSKLRIDIEVKENVHFHLKETREGAKTKVKYEYRLKKNSEMRIHKCNHVEEIEEKDLFWLEEEGARLFYTLQTLALGEEVYDIAVYHMAPRTDCYLTNKAVSMEEGKVSFHVNNIVQKGKVGCTIDQNSRIITLNDKKQVIKPILLIDENDVSACHSAHIGSFEEETLFYLQSRGIPYKEAIKLLLTGFLLGEEGSKKMKNWIDTYWR